jgi:hypothetical protein
VKSLLVAVRRKLLFERWTLAEPANDARMRAAWPRWRRMVRPVGATAFLAMTVLSHVFKPDGARELLQHGGIMAVLIAIILICLLRND